MNPESITLYFKDGSSDKTYQAQLEAQGELWVVNFQYGRRGSSLTAGTKTASAVDYPKAKKIYDKLVTEKTGKGYTEGGSGTPYQGNPDAGVPFGYKPQLCNFVSRARAEELIRDDNYFMQVKMDGHNRMTQITATRVIGANRRGLIVDMPETISGELAKIPLSVFQGEQIGDHWYGYDVIVAGGDPVGHERVTAEERARWTFNNLTNLKGSFVHPVRTAWTTAEKRALFDAVEAAGGEGLVFKRKAAPYEPGRPNSGGSWLKFKFKGRATCLVLPGDTGARSVFIGLDQQSNPGSIRSCGKCTIYPNHAIPDPGTLIDVEYLYAYPDGDIYQPVYIGPRTDISVLDVYEELKFKQEDDNDA